MKERGGNEVVRINNLDEMIRPSSVMVEGELVFQIKRPVLNARADYQQSGEIYDWNERPAAAQTREMVPEHRAAAD